MQPKVEPEVEPPSAAERERAEESLGQLEANLRHLVQGYDSEATESSSGGESCDEADRFPHSNTAYVAIKKRAKYTWLSNRADIASKWTWLTAQGGGGHDSIRFSGLFPPHRFCNDNRLNWLTNFTRLTDFNILVSCICCRPGFLGNLIEK